jgi:uncharacterized membrane protein
MSQGAPPSPSHHPTVLARAWANVKLVLRRYFVAGVLAFAPIGITLWAIAWIVQKLDNLLLPRVLKMIFPGVQTPPSIPFVGAIFTLAVILLFGVIARHLFGWEIVRLGERLVGRVPVARNIYAAVKQLFEAIFVSESGASFRRVVLIEYPRRGIYAIAFTTGTARGIVQERTPGEMVNVFVPTTPNPTSGFYLLVAEDELIPIDITVEQAFKLVMSAGLVTPEPGSRKKPGPTPAAPAPAGSAAAGTPAEER